MTTSEFPGRIEDVDLAFVRAAVHELHPAADVSGMEVTSVSRYGEGNVSTSNRATMELRYAEGSPAGLPERVVVKLGKGDEDRLRSLYETEVEFYGQWRPRLGIEAPRALGAAFSPGTGRFFLILEDLRERGARFPDAVTSCSPGELHRVIDNLARLHARFWGSEEIAGLQTHVSGRLHEHMSATICDYIGMRISQSAFKRDLLGRLRVSNAELWEGVQAVQRHQATLPQTLLHGDTHIGNTYLLPDGSAGLLDWQLTVRGAWCHDLHYLLVTALPIEERRRREGELLDHYLGRLRAEGVASPPTPEEAWRELRRAVVWGLYVGWLTTAEVNYGGEVMTTNLERLATAYEDWGTAGLVAEVS